MKIGVKIFIAQAGIVSLGLLALIPTYQNSKAIEQEYHIHVDETLAVFQTLEDLRFAGLRIVSSTSEFGFIQTLSRSTAGNSREAMEEISESLEEESSEIAEAIESFETYFTDYSTMVDQFLHERSAIRDEIGTSGEFLIETAIAVRAALIDAIPAIELLELKEVLEDAEQELLTAITNEINRETKILTEHREVVTSSFRQGQQLLLLIGFFVLAGASLISIATARTIVNPIDRLTRATSLFAKGEFPENLRVTSQDEVGKLTGSFLNMAKDLRDLMRRNVEMVEFANISERRFRDIAEAASDWIWETDQEHRITYLSDRFTELTGREGDAILGKYLEDILATDGSDTQEAAWDVALKERRAFRDLRCRYITSEGASGVGRLSGKPLLSENGDFLGFRGTASDITAESEAEARAQHLALHDPLTELPNRLLLADRFNHAVKSAGRGDKSVALLCIDLDHFKDVNDTLGHATGDALLVETARRLRGAVRETDTVARIGGDEFCIVQTSDQQPRDAEAAAQRIVDAIGRVYDLGGHQLQISASVGVALYRSSGETYEELMKSADIALYRAKDDGRDTFRFFEPGMDAEIQERKELEHDLREAIRKSEFEVLYQPMVDTKGQKLIGVEALIRWNSPQRGQVLPGTFIGLAEDTGLIIPMGEWVLRTACEAATKWPDIFVSVNLSPVQFRQPDLVRKVREILNETGLPPERLELEITEGVLLQNTDFSLAILDGLKDIGVKIAMDDFGTGYSSLSYLQRFDFDKIKLDQSFVRQLEQSDEAGSIVRAVLGLAKSLGMKSTAEGVETKEQLEFLEQEGCDQLQGWYFGRATRPEKITDILVSGFETEADTGS